MMIIPIGQYVQFHPRILLGGVDGAWSRAKLAGYTVSLWKTIQPTTSTRDLPSFKLQFTPSLSTFVVTRIRCQFVMFWIETLHNVNVKEAAMKMKARRRRIWKSLPGSGSFILPFLTVYY